MAKQKHIKELKLEALALADQLGGALPAWL